MATIKEIFSKRKVFNEANERFSLPKGDSLYTNYYLDTWNVIPFYGKVNTRGIPIMPKNSLIRHCTYGSDKKQVTALQPLFYYFSTLREQYLDYYSLGAMNKNSKFYKKDIPPMNGYINNHIEYAAKLDLLYSDFVQFLIRINKFNSIRDEKDFINYFLGYIKDSNRYFTRAGFVESYDFSPLNTGLSIDLYEGSTSNEELRLEYFNDVNHDAFLELCVRNNFKIDKNVPWRIHLDIRTKTDLGKNVPEQLTFSNKNPETQIKIEYFISEFEDDLELFFETYYDKAAPCDSGSYEFFIEFIQTIVSFYFSFVSSYPTYKNFSVLDCGKASVSIVNRAYDLQDFSHKKYFQLYLDFRNIELSKVVEEDVLNNISNISKNIFDKEIEYSKDEKKAIIKAIKYYSENVGTLAYRSPSLYQIDKKEKMS